MVSVLKLQIILHNFLSSADLFQKMISAIPSVSNSLDPDQARHFVGPDLGPNCLQMVINRQFV